MQTLKSSNSNRHLKKTAPFCELSLAQTSVCSGETLHPRSEGMDGTGARHGLGPVRKRAF